MTSPRKIRGMGMTPLEQWHEFIIASGQSYRTAEVRVSTIRSLARHAGVDDPLALTRAHVVSFFARPMSQWTRVTYWQGVKRWSDFLREFDLDPESNLTKGLHRPRSPQPVARPITDEAVRRLLAARLTPRAAAYVRLALYEGLRVHEIAKVRGEDFDLAAGWLTVKGKGAVTAVIPIHAEIARLAEQMPESGWWFPSLIDPTTHISAHSVSATIGNALRQIGSFATAHQLRDTIATRVQRQVKDIRVTQSLLRHQNVRSTQKYTAVADDDLRAAVGGLDWGSAA